MDVRGYTPAGFRYQSTGTIDSQDSIRCTNWLTTSASPGNAAYPAANLAIYVPFWVDNSVTVYETWVETGTLTTSNATEIGVYDTAGARLFTTATTVATASDTVNSSGMTDYVLGPGRYYLAFGCDGTRNFNASILAVGLYQGIGIMEQTGLTGASLPSTATFATFTRAFLPVFGLNLRNVAL